MELNEATGEGRREEDERAVFARRLLELRTEKGWSQYDLATRAGLTPTAIGHYERQERSPKHASLVRLAAALDTTPDYLWGKTDNRLHVESLPPEWRKAFEKALERRLEPAKLEELIDVVADLFERRK